jgi:hypothetical protein
MPLTMKAVGGGGGGLVVYLSHLFSPPLDRTSCKLFLQMPFTYVPYVQGRKILEKIQYLNKILLARGPGGAAYNLLLQRPLHGVLCLDDAHNRTVDNVYFFYYSAHISSIAVMTPFNKIIKQNQLFSFFSFFLSILQRLGK